MLKKAAHKEKHYTFEHNFIFFSHESFIHAAKYQRSCILLLFGNCFLFVYYGVSLLGLLFDYIQLCDLCCWSIKSWNCIWSVWRRNSISTMFNSYSQYTNNESGFRNNSLILKFKYAWGNSVILTDFICYMD
jgi:hypothetical protein